MRRQKIDDKPKSGFFLCNRVPQQQDIMGAQHFDGEIILCVKVNASGPPRQIRVDVSESRVFDKRKNRWEIRGDSIEDHNDRGTKRQLRRKYRCQFLINQRFGWFEYLDQE